MRKTLSVALALALLLGLGVASPASVGTLHIVTAYRTLNQQGSYWVERTFSVPNACSSTSGLDFSVRIQVRVSRSGDNFTITNANIRIQTGEATINPQWVHAHPNPSRNFYREQSGTVWEGQTKSFYYSPNLAAYREGYVFENVAVGMPHPEAGCSYEFRYILTTF